MSTLRRTKLTILAAAASLALSGCLFTPDGPPDGPPSNEIPALVAGVIIVAIDIRDILDKSQDGDTDLPLKFSRLLSDLDALAPLIPDGTTRARLLAIIDGMQQAVLLGLLIREVVRDNVDGLRTLRDEFLRIQDRNLATVEEPATGR